MWASLCVCVGHPNRAVRQDTQVVPQMNSTAVSVSRAVRTEPHRQIDTHSSATRDKGKKRKKREKCEQRGIFNEMKAKADVRE